MKNKHAPWMLGLALLQAATVAQGEPLTPIAPDHPAMTYDGYVHREIIKSPDPTKGPRMRFDRVLDMGGKGYRWDNPGACIRFRSDAPEVNVVLDYNDLHISTSARNGRGVYSVDGLFKERWSFQPTQKGVTRHAETVVVPVSQSGTTGFHEYAIYLPYGDSVDFGGLMVSPGAKFESVKLAPSKRYVAYGDSITHGFSASEVSKTYPFLLAKEKSWQLINLGLGGRSSTGSDGKVINALKPDAVTILMGANDWQGGVTLERYRENMGAFLDGVRSDQPEVPIYVITPLWVNPSWKPAAQITSLENYRQVLREVVAARKDRNLIIIEGAELIDPNPALYDPVPVHPNDAGFAQMGERLGRKIAAKIVEP